MHHSARGSEPTLAPLPPTDCSAPSRIEAASSTPLLDTVRSPADLRKLSRADLKQLCGELRAELISAVSQVGGHFASSLGVVELTVAVHACFDTPDDRLVWDVGHQAYIHKIITGRRADLPRVRQRGGISGFPRRGESEYDTFGVAHAGTSISAALGMIEASHHQYPGSVDRRVVAVIGDGAMTAGMAFEALNHSGQLHRKLVVILNDNEMSIAPNVGALSWAFSRAVTNRFSTSARRHFKSLVERGLIPRAFYRALDRAEEAAQGFFSTPAMLFESFGYRYIGPIDGHNLDQVIEALENAKAQDGPVLIHALTVKGKGYEPAEVDPVKWHGVSPFDPDEGEFKKSSGGAAPPSYTSVFGRTMVELCKVDPRIVAITAAMPDGTGLTLLQREMPDRFFDVGIAEQHAVTFAAGLSCEGMRPFVAIYSTFLQRAYDQVIHDVCIQSLPVVFAMDRGGLVGADGPTHHGVFDIAYLRTLPNIVIMAPKDEAELRDMMFTAANHETGPIAFRYPRGNGIGADLTRPPRLVEIGRAELLRRAQPGPEKKVLLIGYGATVATCSAAADRLAAMGVSCSVLNARFVKPLDDETLCNLIPQHDLTVTVEDHALMGGFGSAVAELIADRSMSGSLMRLGIEDIFVEHGTQEELYCECGYDVESVVSRALGRLNVRALKVANRDT